MALVADTSGLYASIDRDEPDHAAVRRVLESERGPVHVPELVLAELDYLILTRLTREVELTFLDDLLSGAYQREALSDADLRRSMQVIERYADHKLGLTDASVLATAERLNVPRILTLDERHFRTLRFRDRRALTLLPGRRD
ncbi:MAG: type II toxin-antitoxin system VapC family toxin [Myxococcaceae bacterium]